MGALADAFARTVPSALDRDALMGALRAEIDLYRLLADPLLRRHGVDVREDARRVVRAALDHGSDWTAGPA